MMYRLTLDYETPEQMRMLLQMVRATAPRRFRLRIIDNKGQTMWREDGHLPFRPEPTDR